jgi:hypothetical protein
MPGRTHGKTPLTTVDVRELNTLMWGPLRAMFPSFAEEIELARYLKGVLAHAQCKAVQIERHPDASGQPSTHIFDVYFVSEPEQAD